MKLLKELQTIMTEIIKTYVDHSNRCINIEIMRPPRNGGAYQTFRYDNITNSSQNRLLKILQICDSKYYDGHLETIVEEKQNGKRRIFE